MSEHFDRRGFLAGALLALAGAAAAPAQAAMPIGVRPDEASGASLLDALARPEDLAEAEREPAFLLGRSLHRMRRRAFMRRRRRYVRRRY
jgi:hypothetical protein